MIKSDQLNAVLPMKFMLLGFSKVTLRSETLLYMSTPQQDMYIVDDL